MIGSQNLRVVELSFQCLHRCIRTILEKKVNSRKGNENLGITIVKVNRLGGKHFI
jgi:hypothetical protein